MARVILNNLRKVFDRDVVAVDEADFFAKAAAKPCHYPNYGRQARGVPAL